MTKLIRNTSIKLQKQITTNSAIVMGEYHFVEKSLKVLIQNYIEKIKDDLTNLFGSNLDNLVSYDISYEVGDTRVDNLSSHNDLVAGFTVCSASLTVVTTVRLSLNVSDEVKSLNHLKLKHPSIEDAWRYITSEEMGVYSDFLAPFIINNDFDHLLDLL